MWFRTLLDSPTPRPTRVSARKARRDDARRPATPRLRVEPLEDRSVPAGYLQTNLVADQPGAALLHDPELVNAWGIALNSAPTGAFWISCEGTGLSTLYTGDVTKADGSVSPFVKGALTVTIPGGAPTGQVFNASATDFFVRAVDSAGNVDAAPSKFITVSDTGHLTGWAATVPSPPAPSRSAQLVGTTPGAVYTGLAIGGNAGGNFLYAADFRNGEIDVFDRTFAPTTLAGDFVDPTIPDDYAPFNIQNLGGKLYVAYAQQDADAMPDKGHGFVSVFDTSGNFLSQLVTKDHLKAPWGLALAPANFGDLSNTLLVGNYGDGRVNAYDVATGAHIDRLRGTDGEPVKIDGLLGLHFGNGRLAGDLNALYFTAGPDDGAHGLMGSLRVAPPAAAAMDNPAGAGVAWGLLGAPTGAGAGGVVAEVVPAAIPAEVVGGDPAAPGRPVGDTTPPVGGSSDGAADDVSLPFLGGVFVEDLGLEDDVFGQG